MKRDIIVKSRLNGTCTESEGNSENTKHVPNLFITRVQKKLDNIVHPDIRNVTYPASDTESENSLYIDGQAVPKRESGIPSPIKAMYITIRRSVAIIEYP